MANYWRPTENLYRLLVPNDEMKYIIGPRGNTINRITQEYNCRIQILRTPELSRELAVAVSCRNQGEETPPAMVVLLELHQILLNMKKTQSPEFKMTKLIIRYNQILGGRICAMAAGNSVTVVAEEDTRRYSLPDDMILKISGPPLMVHETVRRIANRLKSYLYDRTIISLFHVLAMPRGTGDRAAHQEQDPPSDNTGPQPFVEHPQIYPSIAERSYNGVKLDSTASCSDNPKNVVTRSQPHSEASAMLSIPAQSTQDAIVGFVVNEVQTNNNVLISHFESNEVFDRWRFTGESSQVEAALRQFREMLEQMADIQAIPEN